MCLDIGVYLTIRTYSNLDSEELAPGYPVARWRNDTSVDRDLRRFFTTLVTKSPFLNDIVDPGILNSVDLPDFFHGEDRALGLGVAFLLDGLAISLKSEPQWYESRVQLRIVQLDDNEELSETIEEIPHASTSEHVREHLDWINARLQNTAISEVNDGMDIWKHKDDWFPSLYFCEKVGEQIQALVRGNLQMIPIIKRLRELEDFCKGWQEGPSVGMHE
ncbi:MAG: hypothetical protein NVS3B14_23600 [Ktedonobacteraceae bacterium]